MSNVLAIFWNVSFAVGIVVGVVGMRLWLHLRCRWLNRHRPYPDGRRHRVPPWASQWLGGALAVVVLTYVLAQGQQTHDETVALSERTNACTTDLITSANLRGDLSDRRDALSEEQRRIFDEIDRATAELIRLALRPPVMMTPEQRLDWAATIQRDYDARTRPLRIRSAQINEVVRLITEERNKTPLPSPRCVAVTCTACRYGRGNLGLPGAAAPMNQEEQVT